MWISPDIRERSRIEESAPLGFSAPAPEQTQETRLFELSVVTQFEGTMFTFDDVLLGLRAAHPVRSHGWPITFT